MSSRSNALAALIPAAASWQRYSWAWHAVDPELRRLIFDAVGAEYSGFGLSPQEIEIAASSFLRTVLSRTPRPGFDVDASSIDDDEAAYELALAEALEADDSLERSLQKRDDGSLRLPAEIASIEEGRLLEAVEVAHAEAVGNEEDADSKCTLASALATRASAGLQNAWRAPLPAALKSTSLPARGGSAGGAWGAAAPRPQRLVQRVLPSEPTAGAPLEPNEPQALAAKLHRLCACRGVDGGHTRACAQALFHMANERVVELGAQRAALFRKASAAHDGGGRYGGAIAGVYAERAREITAKMKAAQRVAGEAVLIERNPMSRAAQCLNLGALVRAAEKAAEKARVREYDGDTTLDLHGQTRESALTILELLLGEGSFRGTVVIITGKGSGPREGVLHHTVRSFLDDNGLRFTVESGGGAFRVRVD